ncbi:MULTISPECIES: hypothetical protein [unclassified Pseudovibrio]|uniref:hypothetical protein n=1 Tax=unclassified Pseudovibrio TaxID=2627060 RepID=UPI0007AEAC8A|nr:MULTISPECIES: hypothetical protein [unclassified Pseudovibrio]KZK99779.1 hypothetical protein PsW74_02382 [Pseudovibrio sp. W74]KZL11919.1 hypothetical protein PsAD14_00082 [Pseudovibrio sp. Ad14]
MSITSLPPNITEIHLLWYVMLGTAVITITGIVFTIGQCIYERNWRAIGVFFLVMLLDTKFFEIPWELNTWKVIFNIAICILALYLLVTKRSRLYPTTISIAAAALSIIAIIYYSETGSASLREYAKQIHFLSSGMGVLFFAQLVRLSLADPLRASKATLT